MMDEQYSNWQKRQKLSSRIRILYALVFVAVTAGFALLWAAQNGYLNLNRVFGVCGFRQRFALPCPGCGWTHSAQAFVTGHPIEAFKIQPAAGVFCILTALTAVFALLFAVSGVDFGLPKRIFSSTGTKILLAAAIVIILAGWIVTMARTIIENTTI